MKVRIRRLALAFMVCFSILAVYLMFLHIFPGAIEVRGRSSRAWVSEESILRGTIFDHSGQVIAQTVKGERKYPAGEACSHLVGYVSKKYGKAGIELSCDHELLGLSGIIGVRNFWRRLAGNTAQGNDVWLTIDLDMQKQAYDLLQAAGKGAVVAVEPETGRILTAVSSPGFPPESLDEIWRDKEKMENDSPLLNRAFQGLYSPGSTFKIVTGSAYRGDTTFFCPGYIKINGRKISCTGNHGTVDFNQALAYSCNTAFIRMAFEAGPEALIQAAKSMGFNQDIPLELPVAKSRFPLVIGGNRDLLAECAVGQGPVVATPLLMALITCAVANEGVIMGPNLITQIRSPDGTTLRTFVPKKWLVPLEKDTAKKIKEAMIMGVQLGTGRKAAVPGFKVAGKTGTAQVKGKNPHAWFVGFAPADHPRVAVAVVIENGGTGGSMAAPIARKIMKSALDKR